MNHVNLTNITFDNCFRAGTFDGDSYYINLNNITVLHGGIGFGLAGNKNSMNVNGFYAYFLDDGILSMGNGHYITISDVTLLNCGYGIGFFHNGGYINATNVFISNAMHIGLYMKQCNHAYLSNILVTKSYHGGLYLSDIKDFVVLINITITNNSASGIHAEGRMNLKFSNYPSTISNNNSPGNGGGIWISEGVAIFSNTTVFFLNNTAKGVGGAIYSSSVTNSLLFIYDYKPCTLALSEDNFKPLFLNNTAGLGGYNIYGGNYWSCCDGVAYSNNAYCSIDDSLSNGDIMYFSEALYCFDNPVFNLFQQEPISSLVTSRPLGVCICNEDNAINCSARSVDRLIYPGQSIILSLATVGVCGGISPGELVTSNSSMTEVVLLNVSQATSGRNCIKFGYKLYSHFTNGSIFLRHAINLEETIKTCWFFING